MLFLHFTNTERIMGNAVSSTPEREKRIIRTSWTGVGVNVLLSVFKAAAGLLSNSIAIVLDAVNNLSDAFSASVTIIGMKLACKPADKEHPYGHGRLEYFTAVVISVVIIFAGGSSFIESVKKIFHPVQAEYSAHTLTILIVAIAAKIFLSRYVSRTGKEVNSESLIATGADAMFDALITGATLVSAVCTMIFGEHMAGIPLDGILGAAISIVIVKAGYDMMMSPVSELLGERIPAGLAKSIKSDICSIEPVMGAYDLMLHNYGPEHMTGAVHISVPASLTAEEIHFLSEKIRTLIHGKYGVLLTVGIYAVKTGNEAIVKMQDDITKIVSALPGILQVHGMFVDESKMEISFDIVIDFSVKDVSEMRKEITDILGTVYPNYSVKVNIDKDYCD